MFAGEHVRLPIISEQSMSWPKYFSPVLHTRRNGIFSTDQIQRSKCWYIRRTVRECCRRSGRMKRKGIGDLVAQVNLCPIKHSIVRPGVWRAGAVEPHGFISAENEHHPGLLGGASLHCCLLQHR